MAVGKMAHSNSNSNNANNIAEDVKPSIFHDFLGKGCDSDLSPAAAKLCTGDVRRQSEAVPSAPASVGASLSGGRGPISSTSDLGSEGQVGNHFEGVPFYGLRSDFSGTERRFTGYKRSNSDCTFATSARDGMVQLRPDSPESSHLRKMLQSARGEQPRRPPDDDALFSIHPMRPTSSLLLKPATSNRIDANLSKWERAIPMNVGPVVQYPPRMGQVVPFGYQAPSNRFKDTNASPSIVSQAADEGSRTGIKGSGLLRFINASGGNADRNLPSDGKQKSGTRISEPESSISLGRQAVTSGSRQMTIFYGGQAHVFDDVHPNKADIIMALAGSNGGSWSTNYTPKSAVRPPPCENSLPSGETESAMAANPVLPKEFRGRLSVTGSSILGVGSADRDSLPPGVHQGNVVVKEARVLNQAAVPSTDKKAEV